MTVPGLAQVPTIPPVSRPETNGVVTLPEPIRDPLEPVNRAMWVFNEGLMAGLIQPTAKAYRFVVREPVRTSLRNFSRNLTYPGRLLNHLLQARWPGARDETYRFFCNSTVGVAGFIDVATKWDIPKSEADFGQTLGRWGWQPNVFVMLPLVGPSNDRDVVGLAGDSAANPLTYISPYPFETSQPLTYLGPYAYYSMVSTYNALSDDVDDYVRLSKASKDPYADLRLAWSYARSSRAPRFGTDEPRDIAALQTIGSVFFSFQDPEFPRRGQPETALVYTTGDKLPFTYWLQPAPAPIVSIVPGLGSHRSAGIVLGLAEMLYQNGFSVVAISSPFNYEFMEHASTAAVPGYTPVDAEDLHVALTAVDQRLQKLHPNRITGRALLGYSMGAFESLYLAGAGLEKIAGLTRFERFVAIDTPVRLLQGVAKLDEFFQAPSAWPEAEREERIQNTLMKVAALIQGTGLPDGTLPFGRIESQFLIGANFRLILRDAIFSSQSRENLGVLTEPLRTMKRREVYREILQYSYLDYFQKFVVPYYQRRGMGSAATDVLASAGDLRTYSGRLQVQPNVRVIVNRNDFLLEPSDLDWLQATFGPTRLTVFDEGGHLGNMGHPEVQKAILAALQGLSAQP